MCRCIREQARSHLSLGLVRKTGIHHKSPVGAGLLAKAVGQLAVMLNVLLYPRAKARSHISLGLVRKTGIHHKFPVGASLLAMAVGL